MIFLAIAAWLVGVLYSFFNGSRKLPSIVLLIGIVMFFAPIGFFKVAGIALLAVVIWLANKPDLF